MGWAEGVVLLMQDSDAGRTPSRACCCNRVPHTSLVAMAIPSPQMCSVDEDNFEAWVCKVCLVNVLHVLWDEIEADHVLFVRSKAGENPVGLIERWSKISESVMQSLVPRLCNEQEFRLHLCSITRQKLCNMASVVEMLDQIGQPLHSHRWIT